MLRKMVGCHASYIKYVINRQKKKKQNYMCGPVIATAQEESQKVLGQLVLCCFDKIWQHIGFQIKECL